MVLPFVDTIKVAGRLVVFRRRADFDPDTASRLLADYELDSKVVKSGLGILGGNPKTSEVK